MQGLLLYRRIGVKKDRIFLIAVFAVLLLAAAVFYLRQSGDGAMVLVTVGGEEYGTYPLLEHATVSIEQDGVVTNVLNIENGEADMTEADCPDKLCVHQRAISKTNETIVCLPNEVVVQVIGAEESELDSIAK